MAVYWSACLASFAFTWFATHVKHDKEGIGYWLLVDFVAAFPLIFVSAIRFNVGADYISYYRYYLGILNALDKADTKYYIIWQINWLRAFIYLRHGFLDLRHLYF